MTEKKDGYEIHTKSTTGMFGLPRKKFHTKGVVCGYTIRQIYDKVKSKDKKLFIIEKAQGTAEDYGHGDLLIGKYA